MHNQKFSRILESGSLTWGKIKTSVIIQHLVSMQLHTELPHDHLATRLLAQWDNPFRMHEIFALNVKKLQDGIIFIIDNKIFYPLMICIIAFLSVRSNANLFLLINRTSFAFLRSCDTRFIKIPTAETAEKLSET